MMWLIDMFFTFWPSRPYRRLCRFAHMLDAEYQTARELGDDALVVSNRQIDIWEAFAAEHGD